MSPTPRYRPEPRHETLGSRFYDPVEAASFPEHRLRFRNQRWATRVGLESLSDAEWIAHFGRFEPLPENLSRPLALRYHGHQFGVYNPHLGDGRGFLFAQVRDVEDGRLLDLGTKGSGRTPWSRDGDGRLTLKGGVRELLATEMLEALGVYTSKTFSLIETGEKLWRGDEPSPTRSCVLVRLSHSHVRVGTFQRLAFEEDRDAIRALVEHLVDTHFPHLGGVEDPAAAVFDEVVQRSARLAASWMVAGFVHGVLNTDNQNVTGESFDYGPWRFLPRYDPGFVAAYFDHTGQYAYGQQPRAVAWNLSRLAETLLPLSTEPALREALSAYGPALRDAYRRKALRRLGLRSAGDVAEDDATIEAMLEYLARVPVDLFQFFHDWYGGEASADRAAESPAAAHYGGAHFTALRRRFARHVASHPERLGEPHFQRARPPTLVLPEVEAMWDAIDQDDDWTKLQSHIEAVRAMGETLALAEPGGGP